MQELRSKFASTDSIEVKPRLRIGIVAETQTDLDRLKQVMHTTNYDLVYAEFVRSTLNLSSKPEVWLLCVGQASDEMEEVVESLALKDLPIVIDDTSDGEQNKNAAYYISKIDKAHALNLMHSNRDAVAQNVWVLAASAGGPEAVIQFLSALEEMQIDQSNTAFIYAQHIDDLALDNLIQALQRNTHYKVQRSQTGAVISAGQIYVLSPDSEIDISEGKSLNVTGVPWKGDYAPSISQVIAKVGRIYKQCSGAIIFSGMGDDGANAVRLMKAKGGDVYIQSFETCAIDSMPRETYATGCVDFIGSPKELATQFVTTIQANAC